ncbi:MAG: folylpolyglutamate synthase/dihydrofolate synthase family protein [Eubacteriales bacterium]|nr:folylpolyglutamate synthase/dihydrofolate synthase family protein [Eubacteriales bacterium]
MTYEEAVAYIDSVPKFTTKNKPENTIELLNRLGRPERKMKVIHVAGTNGKGSVCAFLSSMLAAGGKHTGLFISPHLIKINERFQINNVPVSDEVFLKAYLEVSDVITAMQRDGFFHPTYFEILFAVAMVIFRDAEVEYVVLETGLGGRLDTTNVVEQPMVSVITSISLDHTEILGETIPLIAAEKAGIIKEGVPVVFDGHNPEAEQVIRDTAARRNSDVYGFHEDMVEIVSEEETRIRYHLNIPAYADETVEVPYIARYQVTNSSLALMAMEVIDPEHTISIDCRLHALANTHWEGRMETVLPGIIVDGAHNEDGIREFVRTLVRLPENRRVVMLFSAVVEKNYEQMVQTICETGRLSEVVVTQIAGSRIVPAETLGSIFRKYLPAEVPVTVVHDIDDAFACACEKKGDGLLFCAGSLYLVGEVKAVLQKGVKA